MNFPKPPPAPLLQHQARSSTDNAMRPPLCSPSPPPVAGSAPTAASAVHVVPPGFPATVRSQAVRPSSPSTQGAAVQYLRLPLSPYRASGGATAAPPEYPAVMPPAAPGVTGFVPPPCAAPVGDDDDGVRVRVHGSGVPTFPLPPKPPPGQAFVSPVLEPLLTPKEVGPILRMTEKALYAAVKRGVVPSILIGRSLRFRRADIVALMDGQGR